MFRAYNNELFLSKAFLRSLKYFSFVHSVSVVIFTRRPKSIAFSRTVAVTYFIATATKLINFAPFVAVALPVSPAISAFISCQGIAVVRPLNEIFPTLHIVAISS